MDKLLLNNEIYNNNLMAQVYILVNFKNISQLNKKLNYNNLFFKFLLNFNQLNFLQKLILSSPSFKISTDKYIYHRMM